MPPWRRKWKPAAPGARQAAAAALAQFGPRRQAPRLLLALLAASLAAHVALTALAAPAARSSDMAFLEGENTYLNKVAQKAKAKTVSRTMAQRVTMPPPPPDPEAVVNSTLSAQISTDIAKTIGKLVDVEVANKLTARVESRLKDELAEAAKNIAEGKLSEQEIKDLQAQFQKRAHEQTASALQEHREETQVEHAKLSVIDWYEGRVSAQLRVKMREELFTHRERALWAGTWSGGNWGWLTGWWTGGDFAYYNERLGMIGGLARGNFYDPQRRFGGKPLEHGQALLPDWPEPSAKQAEALSMLVRQYHDGGDRHRPWDQCIAYFIRHWHPHRADELAGQVAAIAKLWDQVLAGAQGYQDKAAANVPPDQLKPLQQAVLEGLGAIAAEGGKLCVTPERQGQCNVVNRAVRNRVLRGEEREKVYQRLVAAIVAAIEPAIRDMAQTEFREGIIIRQQGMEETLKEFTKEVLALLKRDVEAVVPKPQFDELAFLGGMNPYRSKVTGKDSAPADEELAAEEAAAAKVLEAWGPDDRKWADKRQAVLAEEFAAAADRVSAALVDRLTEEGRLRSDFYNAVETVDYTDKVKQRLEARRRAMEGRGQDLAKLTDEGVPDTSASMIALMFGASKGHGASLQPVEASMQPLYLAPALPEAAMRASPPSYPPPPTRWRAVTQAEPKPPFKCHRAEAIPFLANFPKLDGDLTDWGSIRPLVTQKIRWITCPEKPFLIYMAWNYQGFFIGYRVDLPPEKFCYPEEGQPNASGLVVQRPTGYRWAYRGDNIRLLFDTLDARGDFRGEPHTQEFCIFPRGTETAPDLPGIERIIKSTRDCVTRTAQWGEIKAQTVIFPPQPAEGPDGSGPYRVCKMDKDGYSVEAFLPRSLFRVPVFAPGWWIGFECVVGMGSQQNHGAVYGQLWANFVWNGHGELGDKDFPKDWGDILLLGTDPQVAVQNADPQGSLASCVVPGHSYLVTVIDPDRNVNLAEEDTVLVSAEALGGGNDVEVLILKETGKNTSVFRGYVNTQPGPGRQVQGVIECLPGQSLRLGYVDFANARGDRNVTYHVQLPVVSAVTLAEAGR